MSFLQKLNIGAAKEALETSLKAAQESIASFDVDAAVRDAKDAATAGIKAAQDGISNFDVAEAVQGAKDAAAQGANAIGKTVEGITKRTPEENEEASPKDLITLLWCLAYADGIISESEKELLDELCGNIDEAYEVYRAEFEQDFTSRIQEDGKEFGHLSAVKIEAQKTLESLRLSKQSAKLLCWNLLALANCDELDESELDLIRFIGEKSDVEPSVLEELRNYSDAIVEIAETREQLKQSNRSYAEIEPIINELAQREQTLIKAAQSLVSDR